VPALLVGYLCHNTRTIVCYPLSGSTSSASDYLCAVSFLLHIDTAVETASVCLSKDDVLMAEKVNPSQKDSASWLHVAINDLLKEHHISVQQLKAVAVSAGPGSYTGLRVGMSAAKGLCYALRIPLLTVNTLQQMAASALPQVPELLLCPLIDARRMEVFAAIYNTTLTEVQAPFNIVIEASSFAERLSQHKVVFFGNGSDKTARVINHPNAVFANITTTAQHMIPIAWHQWLQGRPADLAYAEPFYGKAFYTPPPKMNK
jgi:tRNA threonylcarbamoyladenosine biosynthesis protein TsaB